MLNIIVNNRKAKYSYEIIKNIEAGIVLEGWEVKSLRAGKAQLVNSYITIVKGEAYLIGSHISPLNIVSKQTLANPNRKRKLLLSKMELNKFIGLINRQGYTIIPLDFHWQRNKIKLEIALAKGKKLHDKRQTEKDRTWKRQKQIIVKIRY